MLLAGQLKQLKKLKTNCFNPDGGPLSCSSIYRPNQRHFKLFD
jgi:hypothetical protein